MLVRGRLALQEAYQLIGTDARSQRAVLGLRFFRVAVVLVQEIRVVLQQESFQYQNDVQFSRSLLDWDSECIDSF